jgi:hypothetical protein
MTTGLTKEYVTLDSGQRREFLSGARRDTDTDKPRYDLIPGSALKRWADLMGRGARKYGDRNWERGMPVSVFRASLERHLRLWDEGDVLEDHIAAILFNAGAIAEMEKRVRDETLPGWYLDEGASIVYIADENRIRYEMILENAQHYQDIRPKYRFMQHQHGDILFVFDTKVLILSMKDFAAKSDDELLEWTHNELFPPTT